jgi:hypothetical protein
MASSVIINFRVSACKLDNYLSSLLHQLSKKYKKGDLFI